MDQINFHQIRIFLEIGKTLSFTTASKNLYIAQPTVSKWLHRLEKELGVTLVERTSRSVTLTEAGEQLYKEWLALYSAFKKSVYDIQSLASADNYIINIGVLQYFNFESWTFGMSQQFENSHPAYTVNYNIYNFKELRNKAHELDIIFTTDVEAVNLEGFNSEIISEIDLYLALSKKHPLANKISVSMEDVKDELFYIFSSETSPKGLTKVTQSFNEKGLSPRFVPVDNIPSQFIQLIRGKGVAITNAHSAANYLNDIRLIPFTDLNLSVHHVCLWHANDKRMCIKEYLSAMHNYL